MVNVTDRLAILPVPIGAEPSEVVPSRKETDPVGAIAVDGDNVAVKVTNAPRLAAAGAPMTIDTVPFAIVSVPFTNWKV